MSKSKSAGNRHSYTDGSRSAAVVPAKPVRSNRRLKSHFRIFRWEFVLVTLAALLLLMPVRMKIKARSSTSVAPAAVDSPGRAAATPVDPSADPSALRLSYTNVAPVPSQWDNVDPDQVTLAAGPSSASGTQPIQFSDGPPDAGQDPGLLRRQQIDIQDLESGQSRLFNSPLDVGDSLK